MKKMIVWNYVKKYVQNHVMRSPVLLAFVHPVANP